jgi:5-methylcytosine-specific restriction endonuclease McrA
MERIILLNADYSFLNVVGWKKAFTLLSKGKVEVLKYSEHVIRSAAGAVMKIPVVMRLIKLIRTIYKARVPFSKRNVMVRDGFKCVYCGTTGVRFTIDHVVPKSKGGKSTFENCVTACKSCNHTKGHKSCREAKMFPKTNLIAPTISEFLRMKLQTLGVKKVLDDVFAGL